MQPPPYAAPAPCLKRDEIENNANFMYRVHRCATGEVIRCYFTLAGCFSKSRNMEICGGGNSSVSRGWEAKGSWFKSRLRTNVGNSSGSMRGARTPSENCQGTFEQGTICSDRTLGWAGDSSRAVPCLCLNSAGIGSSTLPTTPQGGKNMVVFLTVSFHIPSVFH